ncbi:hypothetical protein [Aeribacillus alveayuensis]|uniref:DUF4829 domain-containing protein n=1 Tax=Aeribacillus alveayuensis TaxID=279215 RepID=A0ABT9VLN9_9BACI|nr:hypothetical protein [Bacillus alveayuensis]
MKIRRKHQPFIVIIMVVVLFIFVLFFISSMKSKKPEDVVNTFYRYEQKGDFGSSWDLFHSKMKERFSKNSYVTERSHIYMSHFGVTTFSYKVHEAKKLSSWKMMKEGPTFTNVYVVPVEIDFHSKFGTFTIWQNVYVVKEKQKWTILWEFQ